MSNRQSVNTAMDSDFEETIEATFPRHDQKKASMVLGYGVIRLRIPESHSLKEKRRVVKTIIGKIRNNFNASVAETGANDLLNEADIGFCLVGNDARLLTSKMDAIVNLVDDVGLAILVDYGKEVIHV